MPKRVKPMYYRVRKAHAHLKPAIVHANIEVKRKRETCRILMSQDDIQIYYKYN